MLVVMYSVGVATTLVVPVPWEYGMFSALQNDCVSLFSFSLFLSYIPRYNSCTMIFLGY